MKKYTLFFAVVIVSNLALFILGNASLTLAIDEFGNLIRALLGTLSNTEQTLSKPFQLTQFGSFVEIGTVILTALVVAGPVLTGFKQLASNEVLPKLQAYSTMLLLGLATVILLYLDFMYGIRGMENTTTYMLLGKLVFEIAVSTKIIVLSTKQTDPVSAH